jgi:hypothetical protein
MINSNMVVHVVPSKGGNHYLYLNNGMVAEFDPYSGRVTNVVALPSLTDLQQAQAKTESRLRDAATSMGATPQPMLHDYDPHENL